MRINIKWLDGWYGFLKKCSEVPGKHSVWISKRTLGTASTPGMCSTESKSINIICHSHKECKRAMSTNNKNDTSSKYNKL